MVVITSKMSSQQLVVGLIDHDSQTDKSQTDLSEKKSTSRSELPERVQIPGSSSQAETLMSVEEVLSAQWPDISHKTGPVSRGRLSFALGPLDSVTACNEFTCRKKMKVALNI